MKRYNRVMLGRGGSLSKECFSEGYIGANFDVSIDLTEHLPENWREFNKTFIPMWMDQHPGKTKVAAGLSCSALWTICKGLKIGDIVLSPNGEGAYRVGTVMSDYYYVPGTSLPHRRKVQWMETLIQRNTMSDKLRHSTGSIGTVCDISLHVEELEALIGGKSFVPTSPVQEKQDNDKTRYQERDLHKLMCSYLREEGVIAKTIYHEQSSNRRDSNQKWVHPDIVGVCFEEFSEEATQSLQKAMEPKKAVRLYSYEMKRTIEDDYQLKQYFFQALSNSNWANFGYLVAYEIDNSLEDEINRLNAAFGVGVIQLRANKDEVRVVCPAREKDLDYVTIDKLCHLNDGFKKFIAGVTKVMRATKEYAQVSLDGFEKTCDDIFHSDEELEEYCKKNCIPY